MLHSDDLPSKKSEIQTLAKVVQTLCLDISAKTMATTNLIFPIYSMPATMEEKRIIYEMRIFQLSMDFTCH